MSVLVRSGPATVVASGSATTFGGHPLSLLLRMSDDNFLVELVFESGDGDLSVATEETETGFRMVLTNFDDDSGRGSAVPVLLGALGEDLLFLHFRVFRYGRSADHTVHYTFYRAKADDVGWESA